MPAQNRKEIVELIKKYCSQHDWIVEEERDSQTGIITFLNRFKLDNSIGDVCILVSVDEYSVTVQGTTKPLAAGCLEKMGEFLHRMNEKVMGVPRFQLDYDDGAISIYFQTSFSEIENTDDAGMLWARAVLCFKDYGDSLMKIIHKEATPKDAVNEILNS